MPVRTRVTLELTLPDGDAARELVQMLRLGYHTELGQYRFEVAGAVHIHEPEEKS